MITVESSKLHKHIDIFHTYERQRHFFTKKKKKARRIKNENHCVYNNELIVVKKKKKFSKKKMYKFLQVILHTCRNAEEAYLRAY